jgi:hypothetical protein
MSRYLALALPKPLVVGVVSTAVIAGTGVAASYWTSGGSGSGTAGTAASSASLTVSSSTAPSGMGPGVPAGGVTVTVTNPGPTEARANQVVVSIASVTGNAGPCSAADYTLANATMTTGASDLAVNASTTFSGATLGFNNTASNQDGCKGATVNLAFAVS